MKIIQKNKKAYFDYEILDKFIAGIMLTGAEIKSVREGNVNLKGAYISTKGGEPFLRGMSISRYKYDSTETHDPLRERKLLLNKKEIDKIESTKSGQSLTIVPLAIGLQGRYAKMLLALGIYAIYFNLLDVSRSWVEQGVSDYIWWVPGMLGLLVAGLAEVGVYVNQAGGNK